MLVKRELENAFLQGDSILIEALPMPPPTMPPSTNTGLPSTPSTLSLSKTFSTHINLRATLAHNRKPLSSIDAKVVDVGAYLPLTL